MSKVDKKFEKDGRVAEVRKNKAGKHCVALTGKGITSKLPHMKGQPATQFHGCFSDPKLAAERAQKVLNKK